MTFELGMGLLQSGAVTPDELARALVVTLEPGMPLARALVGLGLVGEEDLQRELERTDPASPLKEVHTSADLVASLPPGLCTRLAALPVSVDDDGTVAVAVLDARDQHVASEVAFHLERPVRLVRAPYALLREALVRCVANQPALLPSQRLRPNRGLAISHTPAWGTPAVGILLPPPGSVAPPPAAPAGAPLPVASVTSSTRRFFVGMRSAGSDPPPARVDVPESDQASPGSNDPASRARGPSPTLREIEPPTRRMRDAPAFPLLASLPRAPASPYPPRDPSVPMFDASRTIGQMRAATERDAILTLVEQSACSVATRVGLFVLRKDALVGWACTPEFADVGALRQISLTARSPGLLDSVLAGAVYLGPLIGSMGVGILRVMKTATRDVAIVAVRVAGKPAVVVVCDDLRDTLLGTRHLELMAKAAGEALERIIRARRG